MMPVIYIMVASTNATGNDMQYKNHTIIFNQDGSYTATNNEVLTMVFTTSSLTNCFARIDS
jgi:hypothetical protein